MPTPVITHTQLGWAYQTGFVNRVNTAASFLTTLIFGGRETNLPTESAELSYREGDRLLAPFVEVNAEAVPVGSRSTIFANVSCPNIRMKRPMEAYQAFLRRQPASGMFIQSGSPVAAARQAAIAEDATYMVDLVENRLEWMVAQMITDMTDGFMSLEYQSVDKANWRLRIPRSTDMDITLGTGWDDVGAAIQANFHTVKRLFSKHVSAPARVCVMGTTASDFFQKDAAVQALLDKRNISAGTLTMISQFEESGAIFLGKVFGIDCWEYSREYINDAGAATPFIGAEKAVFIAGGNALSDSKVLYGAIPDHDAFDAGLFVGKRFAKTWKEPDPSVQIQLLQTRPLPFIRQPNAIIPMDVIT